MPRDPFRFFAARKARLAGGSGSDAKPPGPAAFLVCGHMSGSWPVDIMAERGGRKSVPAEESFDLMPERYVLKQRTECRSTCAGMRRSSRRSIVGRRPPRLRGHAPPAHPEDDLHSRPEAMEYEWTAHSERLRALFWRQHSTELLNATCNGPSRVAAGVGDFRSTEISRDIGGSRPAFGRRTTFRRHMPVGQPRSNAYS